MCPFCQGILFCAQKICSHCKKEQPLKQHLKKKFQGFDEKREEWVVGSKKFHNIASIKDEAIVMNSTTILWPPRWDLVSDFISDLSLLAWLITLNLKDLALTPFSSGTRELTAEGPGFSPPGSRRT
ncbi:hypothetical protein QQF64_014665 [Cirrhinus molitorella]|uniref:Uncharacterized protein n=1 Tax=Cirrhinus molitorella TaxID=172907 RepID=A0ABR3NSR2_9TELE